MVGVFEAWVYDGFDASALLISARQQAGARRRTNDTAGMEIGEVNAFGCQAVGLGGVAVLVPIATEAAVAHVVNHDDNNVRPRPFYFRYLRCSNTARQCQ